MTDHALAPAPHRPLPPVRRMVRRLIRPVLAILLATIAAAAGYAAWLGYLGGPLYTLVPARAGRGDGTVFVYLSGDMGFNLGMGPKVAARLAGAGYPVLGVNALTAFAVRRTPREAAALVDAAVARAAALPGTKRVVLAGQSFGANIVLAALPALPPALRARVPLVELIVPAASMAFRATPAGILEFGDDGPALSYARRIGGIPVLCIHGEAEPGSLCPLWRQPGVATVALPGGHMLNRDDALVAAALLRALHERTGGRA